MQYFFAGFIMNDDNVKLLGNLFIRNREEMDIDNVENVASFDEDYLVLNSKLGRITVEGRGLVIEELNSDNGKIRIRGTIDLVQFSGGSKKGKRGLFA